MNLPFAFVVPHIASFSIAPGFRTGPRGGVSRCGWDVLRGTEVVAYAGTKRQAANVAWRMRHAAAAETAVADFLEAHAADIAARFANPGHKGP